MSRRFSLPAWLAALALLALSMMSAPARSEGVATFNCYGSRHTRSCVATFRRGRVDTHVINVPGPVGDELAAAEARDRRWFERCGPVIRQDRYGMPRYSYRAPGCEFGLLD
ncbi:MAG: hypothetical protein GEU95_05590 [Rhizobiales bacterium]|nr:hypothetical protein [Hyphomicrobiales bacterium]